MRGGEGEGQSSQEGEKKIVVSGEYVAAGGGGYIVRLPEQHWRNSLHPFLLLALSSAGLSSGARRDGGVLTCCSMSGRTLVTLLTSTMAVRAVCSVTMCACHVMSCDVMWCHVQVL